MSKCHIVGNLMVQLIFEYFNFGIFLISIPIYTTLKGKILLPSGSKFFHLRVASFMGDIMGESFQD